MTDEQFFWSHADRQTHIRPPILELVKLKNRAMRYRTECEHEFMLLGGHVKERRRIILWRVPRDNIHFDQRRPQILKIPFLLFADETVEDRDDILMPIVMEIMSDAARLHGVKPDLVRG